MTYKLVAEPVQKQQAEEQQQEAPIEQAWEEVANPAELESKPCSITSNLKTMQCYLFMYCVFMFLGVV
jgi:hypothetical protein